ncbi:MAG: hypothetical protein U0U70_04875 [Chitinophagaceae bacterium]
MRWLLFLSRLGFISGICILTWLVMAMSKKDTDAAFASTIIIIGYVIGGLVLPVTNISYLVIVLLRKKMRPPLNRFIIISNILFLLLLIYYFFYLNDPYYHKR